jgi:hypothetical protein
LYVQSGGVKVGERLGAYTDAVIARSDGVAGASARAAALLGQAVRNQANVLSYSDGFAIVSLVVVGMLVLTAFLRAAPPSPVIAGR